MNLVQTPLSMMLAWPHWQFLALAGRSGTVVDDSIVDVARARWGTAGYALQLLVLAMLTDFLVYWRHRTEHVLFWPIHMVHHSPTELHAANDIGHPMQVWFSIVFITIPLSLVPDRRPGALPVAVSFVLLLLTYYIHSPIDVHFGPLRKVLVDNRFHRIHHSIEPRHFNKNFGIGFSLWDRWFGTAYDPAPDEWPQVGLKNVDPPRTVRDYLLLPFRAGRMERRADQPQSARAGPCLTPASFGSSSPPSSAAPVDPRVGAMAAAIAAIYGRGEPGGAVLRLVPAASASSKG